MSTPLHAATFHFVPLIRCLGWILYHPTSLVSQSISSGTRTHQTTGAVKGWRQSWWLGFESPSFSFWRGFRVCGANGNDGDLDLDVIGLLIVDNHRYCGLFERGALEGVNRASLSLLYIPLAQIF